MEMRPEKSGDGIAGCSFGHGGRGVGDGADGGGVDEETLGRGVAGADGVGDGLDHLSENGIVRKRRWWRRHGVVGTTAAQEV